MDTFAVEAREMAKAGPWQTAQRHLNASKRVRSRLHEKQATSNPENNDRCKTSVRSTKIGRRWKSCSCKRKKSSGASVIGQNWPGNDDDFHDSVHVRQRKMNRKDERWRSWTMLVCELEVVQQLWKSALKTRAILASRQHRNKCSQESILKRM